MRFNQWWYDELQRVNQEARKELAIAEDKLKALEQKRERLLGTIEYLKERVGRPVSPNKQ